ncbi:WD repeat-containing protein mio-B [Capsaspora owczarzaki ATCC 30864]|uniref:WD repeat-containing protein mio-B n=1 Tax=Capsaspora owczarzaki (strain ATCC 30864) TaxID=595528 RepID=A0A0D2WJS7_CAPO3|nr:WD repeat-containing protein mio-B [Capsaspora owczarzaki ATCC 30864]
MSRRRVLWAPPSSLSSAAPSHFIVAHTDIRLYEVSDVTRPTSSSISARSVSALQQQQQPQQSQQSQISLVGVNSDFPLMRCAAWCESPDARGLLAVGQMNGHVGFATLSTETDAPRLSGFRDFEARYDRACNAVAWNPVYTTQLAAGLDRGRTDYSLRVWDVASMIAAAAVTTSASALNPAATYVGANRSGLPSSGSTTKSTAATIAARAVEKPLAETCNNDAVQSLAWMATSPSCLLVGGGSKWLRIYDFRADVSGRLLTTSTKAVLGVAVNPFNAFQFASFSPEGAVKVWDSRRFTDAVLSLNVEPKNISDLLWCPTRSGLLSSVSASSSEVLLWDIKSVGSNVALALSNSSALAEATAFFGAATAEATSDSFSAVTVAKAWRFQNNTAPLASFAWHPTQPNSLLTVSDNANAALEYNRVTEAVSLAWSPQGPITWGNETSVYQADSSSEPKSNSAYTTDASFAIRSRAIAGYGVDILTNLELLSPTDPLLPVWSWMHHVSMLSKKGKAQVGKLDFSLQGVKAVMAAESKLFAAASSAQGANSTTIAATHDMNLSFQVYHSAQRKLALKICDWGFERDRDTLENALRKLEGEDEHERASAIALFHLDIRRAIQSLNAGAQRPGADSNLTLVAMALAGYAEKNALWKEMCGHLRSRLQHPYLRAAFAFLTAEPAEFSEVLEERGVSLADRVGFACRFLNDSQLTQFATRLTAQVTKEGNLDGLVLTGLTGEGIDLLEQYVNMTGDVQTACLLMVRKKTTDARARQWTESYRDLLDMWQLWHERALFDVARRLFDDSNKPPQQVFVRCNMCNISVSRSMLTVGPSRDRPGAGGSGMHGVTTGMTAGPPSKPKVTSCPSCRKALPRCALCLIPLGTSSAAPSVSDGTF